MIHLKNIGRVKNDEWKIDESGENTKSLRDRRLGII